MKIALAVALMLASAGAAALGLGQIVVKSRIGQPLLAEIPVISNDPAELEELRAGLASPETFARIGLQPPVGVVADLQFEPALDGGGRPVIRVTSAQPVTEPLLTFLVQVDWGQGRLVREYSALVDTPRTVSAPVQPPIDAPVVAVPDMIARPMPAASAPPPNPASPATAPPPVARAAEPARRSDAIAPSVPPRAPVAPTVDASPAVVASEYGPVKAGESLSQIAGRLDVPGGVSLEHSMIALLRANPSAFIGGNINQLKQGSVLRVPASTETADLDARQAMALVRAQGRQWRQNRAAAAPAASAASSGRVAGPAAVAAPAAARASGARLEIVPPGASRATRAGTQSGITAGGEGQMLRQELQQTKESLAARDAELRELKGRVADLEKLQSDQQQLLTLKDSELAAAQQRLAASNRAAAAPVASVATPPSAAATPSRTAATADPATPATQASNLPWVLGGFGALALALLAAWLLRRRAASRPKFVAPAPMSAASLADAFAPVTAKPDSALSAEHATATEVAHAPGPRPFEDVPAAADVHAPPSAPATPAPPVRGEAVAAATAESANLWDRRERQQRPTGRAEPATATATATATAPAWHGAAGKSRAAEVAEEAVGETPVGERIELAQAYLDLGDRDSARQLLAEVVASGDPAARQKASRMLRELE